MKNLLFICALKEHVRSYFARNITSLINMIVRDSGRRIVWTEAKRSWEKKIITNPISWLYSVVNHHTKSMLIKIITLYQYMTKLLIASKWFDVWLPLASSSVFVFCSHANHLYVIMITFFAINQYMSSNDSKFKPVYANKFSSFAFYRGFDASSMLGTFHHFFINWIRSLVLMVVVMMTESAISLSHSCCLALALVLLCK